MKTALEPFMIYYGMDLFKKAPANRNNIIEDQLPCNLANIDISFLILLPLVTTQI